MLSYVNKGICDEAWLLQYNDAIPYMSGLRTKKEV